MHIDPATSADPLGPQQTTATEDVASTQTILHPQIAKASNLVPKEVVTPALIYIQWTTSVIYAQLTVLRCLHGTVGTQAQAPVPETYMVHAHLYHKPMDYIL